MYGKMEREKEGQETNIGLEPILKDDARESHQSLSVEMFSEARTSRYKNATCFLFLIN